jgi:hypothetical protein
VFSWSIWLAALFELSLVDFFNEQSWGQKCWAMSLI